MYVKWLPVVSNKEKFFFLHTFYYSAQKVQFHLFLVQAIEMSTIKKETRYLSLSPVEELDLENDSDSTLASSGFLGKNGSQTRRRPSKASNAQRALIWLRWGSIFILLSMNVLLQLWKRSDDGLWSQMDTETGGDINGLYVPREFHYILHLQESVLILSAGSHTYTLLTPDMNRFVPNMTTNANRMEIRNNWDMLMPRELFQMERVFLQ